MRLIEEASRVAESETYLTHDSLDDFAGQVDDVFYVKRDFLFHSGQWRGKTVYPPIRVTHPSKVVIGHSDFPTTAIDIARLHMRGVTAQLYVSNLAVPFRYIRSFKACPLPLGLTNPTQEPSCTKFSET